MPATKISNAILATKYRIKFKDIFNLKELYVVMKEWLLEYEWSSVNLDGKIENNEWWETLYLEEEGTGGDKFMWWWWRLQKIPRSNSYFKWHLDIDSHIVYMTSTQVMRDGQKFKANKGEIEITVWAYVEFDYKGEWSKHPILRFLNKTFPNRIFKKDLYELTKKELYREAYTFQAFLKKWFKLFSFLPYEEVTPFHPSQTYPEWKK